MRRGLGLTKKTSDLSLMRSIHHRGTAENPGLVLALSTDRKSFCEGLAFEVEQGNEVETLEYLRGRELVSSAYLEKKYC